MEIDWNSIKTEYITTNTSYRKLAAKYSIPQTTVYHRGKTEKWVELKKQHCSNVVAKSVEEVEKQAVDYKSELYKLAYKVALQIGELTEKYDLVALMAIGVKPRDITGAIKDLEDILHVKSEADIKEQQARIKKLQKEADAESNAPSSISIKIEGGEQSWNK